MAIINAIKVTLDSNMNTKMKNEPVAGSQTFKRRYISYPLYVFIFPYCSWKGLGYKWYNGIFIRNAYLLHAYIVDICMPNDMRRPYIPFHIRFCWRFHIMKFSNKLQRKKILLLSFKFRSIQKEELYGS